MHLGEEKAPSGAVKKLVRTRKTEVSGAKSNASLFNRRGVKNPHSKPKTPLTSEKEQKQTKIHTTFNNGYLGSRIDEERSFH
ncbi:hypothetical protein, partial [Streptomyces griseofuscus]|uniref:hypothetical protein n=1 Tax=Streptomyces griseofuscus TaxID=146922 RepID=UPI0011CF561C